MSQRILFRLSQNHLLVANTGKAFSKEGFEAICYTDTSAKRSGTSTSPSTIEEANGWINEVLCKKRLTFSDANQLASATGTEQRTASDYAGRLILELLQNAIDADREHQIGYKGIGFRSVVNEGKSVEIHSGNLHVCWSDSNARLALHQFVDLPERLPILDLPAWQNADDEIQALSNDGYDTCIRLLLSPIGKQHLEEEWQKFSSDTSLLLFIDGETEIRWETEGGTYKRWSRSSKGDIVSVVESVDENEPLQFCWRCFEVANAKVAYSVNKDSIFKPSGITEPRLRCYFPATQSPHPFPNLYLHHGSFRLLSNRESVVLDDDFLKELAEAMVLAVSSVKTESDVLDLLRVGNFESTDVLLPEARVWRSCLALLTQAKLQGLDNRSLESIKTCPKNDSLPYGWHDDSKWSKWAAFLSALNKERPDGLAGLPVLRPGIENSLREATLLAFNPDCRFSKTQLRANQWAPVEEIDKPSASSTNKIFLPHHGTALHPPEGVAVRFLKSNFVKLFTKMAESGAESFLKETLGVEDFSALGVIKHCVIPSLLDNGDRPASEEMIFFLKTLCESDKQESKKSVTTFDWNDQTRTELIQKLHIECQGRSWALLRIYAGSGWTGSTFLDEAYGSERGFLECRTYADEEEKKSWERFWKWLGVGWCPKVLPLLFEVVHKRRDKKGWNWNGAKFYGPLFPGQELPGDWSDYCKDLHSTSGFTSWKYTPRLKSNWIVDGGASVLQQVGAFYHFCANWPAYQKWVDVEIGYSGNYRMDHDDHYETIPSYLNWLFKNTAWIPSSDGYLHPGRSVFHASCPVAVTLPMFLAILQLPEGKDDEFTIAISGDFIGLCGIRRNWIEVLDKDWKVWLKRAAAENLSDDQAIQRDFIRALYRAILDYRNLKTGYKLNDEEAKPLSDVPLWGIERQNDIDETWHLCHSPESLPFYVDRGDLADVCLPGLRVFPVRLDGLASKAFKHFGLQPLSDALKGKPTDEGRSSLSYSAAVTERIHELTAYLGLGGSDPAGILLQQALLGLTLREVCELKVQFILRGKSMGEPINRAYFHCENHDHSWTLYINTSTNSESRRWEVFAEALLLSCSLPIDKRKEVRDLLQYKIEELPGELLRLGVAPETVDQLKRDRSLSPPRIASISSGTHDEQIALLPATPLADDPQKSPHIDDSSQRPGSNVDGLEQVAILTRGAGVTRDKNPTGPSARPHPEEGMSAQRWLLSKVAAWCVEHGQPEPLWEQNHVDITIPLAAPILIEAKRIEGMNVHWSANQIKMAREAVLTGATYIVALLRPHATEEYEVFWVLFPLDKFGALPKRNVEWAWQVHKGSKFQLGSWTEPEPPPSKAANSFHAEIALDESWVLSLPKGVEKELDRLVSMNGERGA